MSSCVPHCHPAPASRCVAACTQDGKRHRGTCQSLSLQGLGTSSSSGSTGPGHLCLPLSLPQDRQRGCCALKQLAAVRPCQTHTPEPACCPRASDTSTCALQGVPLTQSGFCCTSTPASVAAVLSAAPLPWRVRAAGGAGLSAEGTPRRVINAAGLP